MARRSLQLRRNCVDIAKAALKNSQYKTQIRLTIEAETAQTTGSNFFCGKPVERANFVKFCQLLNLDPDKVGEQPSLPIRQSSDPHLDPSPNFGRDDEKLWCEKLLEPHALIRIQAPAQFGKTSLMENLLHQAKHQGHLDLYLNLNAIELSSFKDARTFFRCFVREIASEIPEKHRDCLMSLEQYDRNAVEFGHTKALLKYLEYLQQQISQPLTLGINKLDPLLGFPDVADEFLFQLRNMHEKSKRRGVWQNFRLVLAYATPRIEDFVTIVNNRSPFNVGYSIELSEFSTSEIARLATTKGVNLDGGQIAQLMRSIGGIPNLVQLALDRFSDRGTDLDTIAPIYHEHLTTLALWLQQRDLDLLMQQIATNQSIAIVTRSQQSLLHRQGLIRSIDDRLQARCELYRQFFAQ